MEWMCLCYVKNVGWLDSEVKGFRLAIPNRLWTADRLASRIAACPGLQKTAELVTHLLINFRLFIIIWAFIKDWMGLHVLDIQYWHGLSIKDWSGFPRWVIFSTMLPSRTRSGTSTRTSYSLKNQRHMVSFHQSPGNTSSKGWFCSAVVPLWLMAVLRWRPIHMVPLIEQLRHQELLNEWNVYAFVMWKKVRSYPWEGKTAVNEPRRLRSERRNPWK